jgi:hypothetical protein
MSLFKRKKKQNTDAIHRKIEKYNLYIQRIVKTKVLFSNFFTAYKKHVFLQT